VLINCLQAYWTWLQYQSKGTDVWVCIAKSSASLMILNNQLLMISMMRVTISRLHYFHVSQLLLFDKHINTHQLCGQTFFLSALVHTLAYIGKALTLNYQLSSNLTGCSLVAISLLFWICAQPVVRKSRYYELFYYGHYLFFPLQILLCLHSHHYRRQMILPVLGYLCDRGYRFYCTFYPSQLLDFTVWPSKILELKISRPKTFNYKPGDYTFICIPEVSKTQWHPFSLSSDPHDHHILTLHMRVTGNWTADVEKLCLQFGKQRLGGTQTVQPLIYLDGPLSTPSSTMIKVNHMILVGQGIGITPFISLIKWVRSQQLKTPRIDLYWMTRDTETMECLNGIIEEGILPHIKINLFTNNGKVDWEQEFSAMMSTNSGSREKPTVFVCGSAKLGKELYPVCAKWKCRLKQENF
jgi:predicted ferric reductase